MLQQALRRFALFAATPALLVGAAPARAAVPVPPAPTITPVATLMSQVVTMTNQQRHKHGCGQVAVDRELTLASVRQSSYMARTGIFTHVWRDGSTFVTRAHRAGYQQPAGENIAWGYPTAAEVVAAWMASPRHRANILNCGARSIGAGVIYGPTGIPYFTEVLGWD